KDIRGPVFFQGGVAANPGICKAFEVELGQPVIVPEHYGVMGALGVAYLAQEKVGMQGETRSKFRGLHLGETQFQARSFECSGCSNRCEVVKIMQDGISLAMWGDRCGKWSTSTTACVDTGMKEHTGKRRGA
ncbi:MAG: 2-hydroxyglutaryl-CoA dehydratase, partial [Desulfosporosinus sp.]